MGRRIIKHDDIYSDTIEQSLYKKTDEEEAEEAYDNHDPSSTMENGTATLMYIIVMIVGAIFIDKWLIWIMASIIYFSFINRRAIRKKKWDKTQEEKKNGGRN